MTIAMAVAGKVGGRVRSPLVSGVQGAKMSFLTLKSPN